MFQEGKPENKIIFNEGDVSKNKPFFKRFRFIITAITAIFLVFAAFFVLGIKQRAVEDKLVLSYKKATGFLRNYEDTMRRDTYGGKIPQETLDLFIAALQKGDLELASKYFALGTSGDDYLNRDKWEEGLRQTAREGRIESVIEILLRASPTKNQSRDLNNIFWYSVYDDSGKVVQDIEFVFNTYSKVWKIQSL